MADLPPDGAAGPDLISAPAATRRAATAAACRCRGRRTARRSASATGPAHLPVPAGFAGFAVERQEADETSTLALYRRALAERRRLQTAEDLEWATGTPDDVVAVQPSRGWTCITNFGATPVPLPAGRVVVSSAPLADRSLPGDTTAWLVAG